MEYQLYNQEYTNKYSKFFRANTSQTQLRVRRYMC